MKCIKKGESTFTQNLFIPTIIEFLGTSALTLTGNFRFIQFQELLRALNNCIFRCPADVYCLFCNQSCEFCVSLRYSAAKAALVMIFVRAFEDEGALDVGELAVLAEKRVNSSYLS